MSWVLSLISLLSNSSSLFYSGWILLQKNVSSNLAHLYLIHIAQVLNIVTQSSAMVLIIVEYFDYSRGQARIVFETIILTGGCWTLLLVILFDLQILSIYSVLRVSFTPNALRMVQGLMTVIFASVFFAFILSSFVESLHNTQLILAGPFLIKAYAVFVTVLDVTVRLYLLTLLSKIHRKKPVPVGRAIAISFISAVLSAIGLTLLFIPRDENQVVYHSITGIIVAAVGLHFSLLKLYFIELGIAAFSGSKAEKRSKEVFSGRNDSASMHSKISVFSVKKLKTILNELPQRSNENNLEEIRQKDAISPKTKAVLEEM